MNSWKSNFLLCALTIAAFVGLPVADSAAEFVTAYSGKTVRADDYYGWDNKCRFKVIDVVVVKSPQHGRVGNPKASIGRIPPAKIGSAKNCLGKPLKKWTLYYTSKPGYRGRDSFSVRMSVDGRSKLIHYTVNVR